MNIWKHFDLLINTLSTALIRQYLNCIQCLACSRQTDRHAQLIETDKLKQMAQQLPVRGIFRPRQEQICLIGVILMFCHVF